MYYFYNSDAVFLIILTEPFLRKTMFHSYTHLCVAKREIQNGHAIKCKYNLSVIYSDCLLCEISVAQNFSLLRVEAWRKVPERHYSPSTHRFIFLPSY